jgi:hypothetical protein
MKAIKIDPPLLNQPDPGSQAYGPDDDSYEDHPPEGEIDFLIMPGVGHLTCRDCGFSEKITGSFSHRKPRLGMQCQACGKIESLAGLPPFAVKLATPCSCGGEFRRNRIVFCPSCRSRKMTYRCRKIS